MAYNALYNFGNVKVWASNPLINPAAASYLFTRAIGTISYTPVWNYSYQTNTGKRIDSLKGYRVNININARFFNDADSRALQFLINQINYYTPMNGIRQPIYIAPRYDSTKIYNNIYACVMTSDFVPIDISNSLSVGQSILLTFLTILLRPNIEYNINFTLQPIVDDDENIWTIDIDGNLVEIQIIGSQIT